MSQHDSHPGSATGSTRPRSVPPGSPPPSARASRPVGGVEPISLRGAVDVRAAEARLAALGQSRSTSALGERADLLRTLGRLDEALAIAEEAFRLAHFTGDRADSTAARIRRAHVLREQGKLERALGDLHTSRITASTEEWRELEATAAELEGYTLFDLGRLDESSEALDAALTAYAQAGVARDRLEALRSVVDELMRAAADGPAHARETGGVTPIGQGTVGAHAAVEAEPQLPSHTAGPAAAPAQPTASPASPPEEGDTNPTGLPRVDGARVDAARVDAARVDQGEGGAQPSPTTADAPAPQAPAPVEPALAAAMRTDPGDAPAASSAPAAPSEPVLDKPSTRADTSLWGKISSLAANAAGHRDRDGERAVVVDAPHVDDDEPRRGATGVTGVVEGLPRDDEPTTWPFPGR